MKAIHALPGMGGDHRMYPEPWGKLPGFQAHDWVVSPGIRSVRQLAEVMVDACAIADGDVMIGSSLGGIVAGEITKLRKIAQLFLVGSAVTRDEVKPWLKLVHPLAQDLPMKWLRLSARRMPGELAGMLADSDPAFIRNMCKAIFQWEGLGESKTQVLRIHGCKDMVISAPKKPGLLLEGGHLIAMTHAHECVAFVTANLPGGSGA